MLKFLALAWLCLLAQVAIGSSAVLATDKTLKPPRESKPLKKAQTVGMVKDTLLIMPAPPAKSDADDDEEEKLEDAVKRLGGKVVDTLGEGKLLVWVVKFDSTDHFIEAEKQLTNDKRVTSLQRNYVYHANVDELLNDPYLPSQWYLKALNVFEAWKISKGSQNILGVVDSGTNARLKDLRSKTYAGYDAIQEKEGQYDVEGHGTMVATTAAATANNGVGTAGPARRSRIYPVRVGYENGEVEVTAILKAIQRCGDMGIKIINLSSNGNPPFSFANKRWNTVLHSYLQWYHNDKGGLVFNSAGNSATADRAEFYPYLIVVSAIDEEYYLASFSTYGKPVWFTAPGTNIACSDRTGEIVSVSGTSFSSPLVASLAALAWGANPSLTNLDIERILIASCGESGRRERSRYFGYGMPDAALAVSLALSTQSSATKTSTRPKRKR